jgi:hypothetical protein
VNVRTHQFREDAGRWPISPAGQYVEINNFYGNGVTKAPGGAHVARWWAGGFVVALICISGVTMARP